MTLRSWIRQLFTRTPRTVRKTPAGRRPTLEALEERTLLDSGMAGGGLPLDNLQPSIALNYIIAVKGVFPQRDGSPSGTGQEALVGEVRLFAGDSAPDGWVFAAGQVLPIGQNTALFSLLGTFYGGNGKTNFALPDLRGQVPIHEGAGHTLGERGGEQAHTLTVGELPTHTHAVNAATAAAGGAVSPAGRVLGAVPNGYRSPAGGALGAMRPDSVTNTGGSQAHLNLQPYLTLSFCIALQGIFPSPN